MITSLGFFHFGVGHDKPMEGFIRCLEEKKKCIANSLIVLPEAFNIASAYRGEGKRNFDQAILSSLQETAKTFECTFVGGLNICENNDQEVPYCGAYLIETEGWKLMGYKISKDDTEGGNYKACHLPADRCNPITRAGLRIGALICADATEVPGMSVEMLSRLRKVAYSCDILCVPAHMDANGFRGAKGGGCAFTDVTWRGKRLIFANSNPSGRSSFITDTMGIVLEPTISGEQNKVEVFPLTDNSIARLQPLYDSRS